MQDYNLSYLQVWHWIFINYLQKGTLQCFNSLHVEEWRRNNCHALLQRRQPPACASFLLHVAKCCISDLSPWQLSDWVHGSLLSVCIYQ